MEWQGGRSAGQSGAQRDHAVRCNEVAESLDGLLYCVDVLLLYMYMCCAVLCCTVVLLLYHAAAAALLDVRGTLSLRSTSTLWPRGGRAE